MTDSTVVSLLDRKQALQKDRLARIMEVLEAPYSLPEGLCVEDESGDLVAPPQAWAYFERLFGAFMVELPTNVGAQATLGATIYLAGHLGSKIKLRAVNESAYQRVQSTLSLLEQQFVESLFASDPSAPAKLIRQLDVLQKRPSDFA